MISLQLLGGIELRTADGESARAVLAQPKRLALLAYLALARPRGHHRRDRLVAIFWPELDQERARAALRNAIHFLRRELGPGIVVNRGVEELAVDAGALAVDALRFESALEAGRDDEALALYRGELLPAFHVSDLPEFERWLDEERAGLARRAADAARGLRDRLAAAGELGVAAGAARRVAEIEPLDQPAARRLVELLFASGERSRALAEAERFEARHRAEYESTPNGDWNDWLGRLREAAGPAIASTVPFERAADPASATPERASPPRRPMGRLFAAIAVVVLLAFGAWRMLQRAAPDSDDVLVLPFTVLGGDDLGYLRDGMVDLLGSRLDGAAGLRTVDPQALHARLQEQAGRPVDLDLGRRVAERFGGASFVLGSVVEAGPQLQVTARLYSADGVERARAEGTAPRDSLFGLVDNLARGLLVGRLDRPEAEVARIAAQTTTSLPALRAYLDGERAMRAGDFTGAFDAFRAATERDTTFALAFYRLSSAADWLGRPTDAREAVISAAKYRSRLEVKDRMLVEARMHFWLGDAAEAERTYQQIVTLRPHSVEGWYEYAEVLFHGGPWMGRSLVEAEPAFRRVLALVPTHASAMLHLARIAALRRDTRLVDSLSAVMGAQEPGHARLAELRLFQVGLRRDTARIAYGRRALDAVDVLSRAMAIDRMAAFTADRESALRYDLPLIEDGVAEFPRRAGLEIGAHLSAGLGRWGLADSLLDRLALVDPLRAAQARALAVLAVGSPTDSTRIRRAIAGLRAAPATRFAMRTDFDLRPYSELREAFYLGALGDRVGDTASVVHALALLDAAAARATDDTAAYARHAAGFLRALRLRARGDAAGALRARETTWPAPRRALMVRWAWNHTVLLARVERAELAAQLGRMDEARAWHDAAIEDIAGTPLVQGRLDALEARLPKR